MSGSLAWEGQYLHLVLTNYQMFTSIAAPPLATGTTTVPQPSSVVYPLGQVQPVSEIMDQLNQLKCVISDLKLGFSDLIEVGV
jgi:hypothetical protein